AAGTDVETRGRGSCERTTVVEVKRVTHTRKVDRQVRKRNHAVDGRYGGSTAESGPGSSRAGRDRHRDLRGVVRRNNDTRGILDLNHRLLCESRARGRSTRLGHDYELCGRPGNVERVRGDVGQCGERVIKLQDESRTGRVDAEVGERDDAVHG